MGDGKPREYDTHTRRAIDYAAFFFATGADSSSLPARLRATVTTGIGTNCVA